MPQIVNGLQLKNNLFILYGTGAPTASSDPNVTQTAGVGSLYLQTDASGSPLWVLTANGWIQATLP